jgi:hypothetical protein
VTCRLSEQSRDAVTKELAGGSAAFTALTALLYNISWSNALSSLLRVIWFKQHTRVHRVLVGRDFGRLPQLNSGESFSLASGQSPVVVSHIKANE